MLNWTDLGAVMAVCKRWAEVFHCHLDLKPDGLGHHLYLHHPQVGLLHWSEYPLHLMGPKLTTFPSISRLFKDWLQF